MKLVSGRLPAVYVESAAIVEGDSEVMIPPKGVIPREPVTKDGRIISEKRHDAANHFLIRAQHTLRIDHSLGAPGRAGSEHDFRNGVWSARPDSPRLHRQLPWNSLTPKSECLRSLRV